MRLVALCAVACAGCPGKHAVVDNVATPAEGTAISLFLGREPGTAIAMIDDRRKLTIANGAIVLERIDAAAQLPSLVIESLDHRPLELGACARERIENNPFALDQLAQPRTPAKQGQPRPSLPQIAPGVLSPLVRCSVGAAPGTYFVRVVQVSPQPTVRALHQIKLAGERATITTRFAFTTPPWARQRATLTVFDALPGGEAAPKAIARGDVVLDGTLAVLANPPVEAPARLRTIFDGAVRDPLVSTSDPAWGRESRRSVAATLELEGLELTSGQVDVEVDRDGTPRTVVVPARDRERLGNVLRLALWTEDALQATRRNVVESYPRSNGREIRQRVSLAVTNISDKPRAVSIEERLRPVKTRRLSGLRSDAKVIDDVVRLDVELAPGATERVEFGVDYSGL